MYSTCLFCHSSLGTNETIEPFPVGRRLAFDAAKGRLWVVCVRCTRWNLTPLDERWEAIEECERVFRETKLRVSTDNIGMARLGEGLELIRVGRALRPEIVVWRYAAANQRRRRRSLAISAVAGGTFCAGYYFGLATFTGPLIFIGAAAAGQLQEQLDKRLRGRHRPLVLPHQGKRLVVTREQAVGAEIIARDGDEWALRLDHRGGTATIADETRLQRLAAIMASVNDTGVSKRSVQQGERLLTEAASTERLIASHATPRALSEATEIRLECPPDQSPYYFHQKTVAERRRESAFWTTPVPPIAAAPASIASLPEPVRAALEMAANEEAERRAMEGELAALAESWREAEEIASIADNLFLPDAVTEAMKRLRGER